MSVAAVGYDGNAFDQRSIDAVAPRFIKTHVRFKLTGNYVSGGDTLDFTNAGGTLSAPNTVPPGAVALASVSITPNGPAGSVGANGGDYVAILGSAPTNAKLKIFATAGTEYAAGAYSADATGDIVTAECLWTRA